MREFINITKALSEKNRVHILMALKGHELCVCPEWFGSGGIETHGVNPLAARMMAEAGIETSS